MGSVALRGGRAFPLFLAAVICVLPAMAHAQEIGGSLLPRDLSVSGMVHNAGDVVRAVLIGLALASVTTWTLMLAKGLVFLAAWRSLRRGLRLVSAAADLAGLTGQLTAAGPVERGMAASVVEELRLSDGLPADGLKERCRSRLARLEAAAARRLSNGTGMLATIGAISPFVGLFGTVWGIMNSFIGISQSQTTNLAVVAPGIAEALLTTAVGLIAAIPAVVIYNLFARGIAGYRARLGDFSAELQRLLSRELDRRDHAT
jgi:biopolymer transport protein ExbB